MQHSSAGMTWTEGAAALLTLGLLMCFLRRCAWAHTSPLCTLSSQGPT